MKSNLFSPTPTKSIFHAPGQGLGWRLLRSLMAALGLAALASAGSAGQIGGTVTGPYAWTNLDTGVDHTVFYGLAYDGTNLYAGGNFTNAGSIQVNFVAKWNGTNWSSMGSGMDARVLTLLLVETNLYAAGDFTTAGGVTANHVARWDGSSWAPVGSGMNNSVLSLASDGTNLYAAGEFTVAGGVPANRVAMWDGANWSAVGSGMTDPTNSVRALAFVGTNLFAGGIFEEAGGVPANRVAMWDGANWSAVGSGMNGSVYSLMAVETNLYAGGLFTTADGQPANDIAVWDGTSWSALGLGMDSSIFGMAHDGTNVYAGGSFTTADNLPANYVAKWDGANWSSLGTGVDARVLSLLYVGKDLYVGGWFTNAGGVLVNNIAKWSAPVTEFNGVDPISGPVSGGFTVTITGTDLGNGSDITDVKLCGVSVESITSQSATEVVVVAGVGTPGPGDVSVFSTSLGETKKVNGFTYTAPLLAVIGTNDVVIASGDTASVASGTDFGGVAPGLAVTNQFSITNSGDYVLNISNSAVTGDATFTLLDALPATLAVGAAATFRVEFSPMALGAGAATLWITNDAPAGTYAVPLAGTGIGSIATQAAGDTVWAGGGSYDWEINQSDGTAGADPGWDLLDITGTLTITATSGSPFTLNLTTLTPPGNAPGDMANFNNAVSHDWTVVRASGGIIGFVPDRFSLNTGGFANALGGGQLALTQVGGEIHLVFSPSGNNAPVAESITAGMNQGQTMTLSVSKILSRATDADGNTLTMTGVSPGSSGVTLTLASGQITYTPASGFSGTDTFAYSISDGHGATATATVTVTVRPGSAASLNVVYGPLVAGPNFVVRFAGIPGYTYTIESTDDLITWVKKQNLTAPAIPGSFGVGVFEFTEATGGATSRFYRTVWPAY